VGKKIKIMMNEPLLILGLPLSLISLSIIILLTPFIRVRIGFLRCDRYGHFAANTELYLCEKDLYVNKITNTTLDLFYYPKPVCNKQLAAMWERKIHVLPRFLMRPLDLLIRSFHSLSYYRAYEAKGGDRDIDDLLYNTNKHLEFTPEEIETGEKELLKMGLNSNSKFVFLAVRDSSYLMSKGGWGNHHDYRDCDIDNFVLASEELTSRGYFVIRMGALVNKRIKTSNPKIIDYAANGMRSEFMDIYLSSRCEFVISTGTGLEAVAVWCFRKPYIELNFSPATHLSTFMSNSLNLLKHHVLKKENRVLKLHEIFSTGVGWCMESNCYNEKGIELIENSPEEIRDVVLEMVDRIEGIWKEDEEDGFLQKKFWNIFPTDVIAPNGVPLHGKIRSKYSAKFLRDNREWLSLT